MKTKLIPHVIVKILEVVAYSNPQQLQGWRSARWQQFKLHLANFNWFNDRSKLKGLDQSVAFDMKGHKLKDNGDWSLLALVAVAVERIVVALGAD